uniref:Uncharacterized protein n=1 Tax=Eptatretus burgeri TaxID=7764 RepID=A0A8C4NCL8_EPTBU
MGSASSEPCLYERLSESIDKLRELGLRWGMSEEDIERCIAQALRVGERRERRSHASPIRTLAWFCLALLTSYWFLSTYQPTQYLSGHHADSWIYPIMRHVRLLTLPIAKHYNLSVFIVYLSIIPAVYVSVSVTAVSRQPLVRSN